MKCKVGSLKILKEIVVHPDIRKAITQMGGIELMVGLPDHFQGVRCMRGTVYVSK